MIATVHIDSSEVNAAIARIMAYAEKEAKADAAEVTLADIRRKTAKGVDADNIPFSAYVKPYLKVREKHLRPTSPKDLNLTGALMKGLYFDAGQSAIVPSTETEKIAEGQMYHPKWESSHHSMFLFAGADTIEFIEQALVKKVEALA